MNAPPTMNMDMLEQLSELIQERYPEQWSLVNPRRYVPPHGYPNPKLNASLLWTYLEFMEQPKPDKVMVDCILTAWQIVKHLCPTYFLGQEFAEALTQTEPPENLTIRELQWPFDGMSFVLPAKFQRQYFGLEVPFVRLAIISTGLHPSPPAVAKQYPHASLFGIDEKAYDQRAFIVTATVIHNGLLVDYSGSFSDADSIGAMMSDPRYQDFCVDPESAKTMEVIAATNIEEDMKLLKKVIALGGHLFLALNAAPEYIEPPQILRTPKLRHGQIVKEGLWSPHYLGRNYRWEREQVHLGGTHASPRLHPRRGHWRKQPIGERFEDKSKRQHKVIWIKPMLVGAKTD